jgi:hypothetical protein
LNPIHVDRSGEEIFLECPDHLVELPCFDGTYPRLWQSRCEEYFMLWATTLSLWIPYASAQFEGAVAKCLESFKQSSLKAGCEEFCIAFLARFGRNQHAALLWQMFHINQITKFEVYVNEFVQLMD